MHFPSFIDIDHYGHSISPCEGTTYYYRHTRNPPTKAYHRCFIMVSIAPPLPPTEENNVASCFGSATADKLW